MECTRFKDETFLQEVVTSSQELKESLSLSRVQTAAETQHVPEPPAEVSTLIVGDGVVIKGYSTPIVATK
jgi:hypothetical protein